ncbi:MAG: hypothetical protein EXS63_07700 [Candidatus Omnitrophica bacterium]|nr:hypothetical protein [Candidatus Omnitrophota bacterium]
MKTTRFLTILWLAIFYGAGAGAAQPGAKISGKVAFESDRFGKRFGICVLENGLIRNVYPQGGANPRWSPDGKRLAIAEHRSEFTGIIVVNASEQLLPYPLELGPLMASWLPDSESLIFASNGKALQKSETGNLYHLNLNTKEVIPLTDFDDGKEMKRVILSRDGKKVILKRALSGTTDQAINSIEYLIGRLDGHRITGIEPLPVYPSDPSWFPNGKKIIYTSGYFKGEKNLKGYLLSYDFETGEEALVYENKEEFHAPVISPDGNHILVSGWSGIYMMNLDGTEIREVVRPLDLDGFSSHDTSPDWAP